MKSKTDAPLTPAVLHILLALATEERHGYGIMRRADGKFWDPSYGAGPFAHQKAWESAAIDGLFRPAGAGAPPGTSVQTGFEKSLNASTKILEFWNLTTGTKL